MPDLKPFAFSICPDGPSHWTWRALKDDGRVEQGAAPTRAAAAACVISILARSQLAEPAAPNRRS